jgi:23S rRNA (cytidine1920-2'-O)/16S rRNA (cytidine1409-2'-O)-methyltransferase
MTSAHDVLAMIKPQFEVGRDRLGKGGVVRSAADRRDALVDVAMTAIGLGESVLGFHSSGLPGPKGNRETFIWLAEAGRPGAGTEESQLREIALEVEP